jgi:hypothetical protein
MLRAAAKQVYRAVLQVASRVEAGSTTVAVDV